MLKVRTFTYILLCLNERTALSINRSKVDTALVMFSTVYMQATHLSCWNVNAVTAIIYSSDFSSLEDRTGASQL